MTAFTLGPLSLPPAHLYAASAAVALLALGHLVRLPPPRRRLWLTGALLGALLGARLADIALHGGAYREAPLEAVMRWQSGYHPSGALLGAGAWTLGCLRRLPPRYLTRASGVLATCAALWWGLNAWHPLAGEPPPSHLPPLSLNALDGDAISLRIDVASDRLDHTRIEPGLQRSGADLAVAGITPLAGIAEHMTRSPKTATAQMLAAEAVRLLQTHRIGGGALLVVDADNRPQGALNMQDLLRAGVI